MTPWQTPETQLCETHCAFEVHGLPFGKPPSHSPLTQRPDEH